ncbi:MAG: hypothetical protein QG656_1280, partial [Candidatus Hydrogenedentes bacterium]|nr:hypothetical protein [Candidatus Hydrogenedentota bacterium]
SFCHRRGREEYVEGSMPEDEVVQWIDWAVDNGIPGVRFTGGEPALHPGLRVFCNYARLRGRYVILNTNGLASADLYRHLFPVLNDVRFSLPLLDAEALDALTGGTRVLERKMAAIELALSSRVPRVALLTVLTAGNKSKLEAFVKLAQTSSKLVWLPLRQESSPECPRPWTRADAQEFAEEVSDLMDRYPEQARGICLAAPFCAVSPVSLGAYVFRGRTVDCGPHTSLCAGLQGGLHACYNSPVLCGRAPLVEVERHPALRSLCDRGTLPEECRRCPYVTRCAGGCRNPSALVPHGDGSVDYLAGFLG